MIGLFSILNGFALLHPSGLYHPTDGKSMIRALEAKVYPNLETRPLPILAPDGLFGFHCQPSGMRPYLDVGIVSYRPAHRYKCVQFDEKNYRSCIGTEESSDAVRKKYLPQQIKLLQRLHDRLLPLPDNARINSKSYMMLVVIGKQVRVYDADHLPKKLQPLYNFASLLTL